MKTHLKSLLVEPMKFLTLNKHLKPQTAKLTTEITKMHQKPDKWMKKQQESQ